MSIAASLERTIGKMEAMWRRGNGDFDTMFPDLLKDARADIERVSGLEGMHPMSLPISAEELKIYQKSGGAHVSDS